METFAAVHLMLSAAMGSNHPPPRKEKKKRRLRGAFVRQLTERIGIDTLRMLCHYHLGHPWLSLWESQVL